VKLLEPLSIGANGVTAPSRVMFGPIETNLGRKRAFTAAHTAFYVRRAVGGAGIVVTEEASVHPSDWPYERSPLATNAGPGWSEIASAIAALQKNTGETHTASTGKTGTIEASTMEASTMVLAALGHAGGQGTSHWNQREMWAPSAVPEVASREVPKIMEQRDIDAVVRGFGDATALAIASGMHGVEINAGQFSIIRQFLSGLTNMRPDEYGQDRLKFAKEVLSIVRANAGGAIVALRLSVDELAPWAGIVPDAGAAIAVELAPFVDLITVVRGSIFSTWATQPDGHIEPGFGIDLARNVRTALRAANIAIPVIAQGSVVDAGQAEWIIDSEAADGVEMTRAQLADASLVSKLRNNQSARIRPCLLCNQTCKVRDNRSPIITCVVDPATGHEVDDQLPSETTEANRNTNAMIVGGGIAGLEAARVAALRGFNVAIAEQSGELGGVLRAAARGAGRSRLSAVVDWLITECEHLGVVVKLHTKVQDLVTTHGRIIVATGAINGTLPFAVTSGAHLVHAIDLLRADDPAVSLPEGPVAVWDPIGGPIALSVAELLAHHGRKVTLITPDLLIGEKQSLTGDLAPAQPRLHGLGVKLVKRALVRRVSDGKVEVEDRFSGDTAVIDANAFIACGHRLPLLDLDPKEQHCQIGDRVAPRTIHEAILEARRAAFAL
jgi:2,4-dienoyl-CoA reductase-like NADH-dependent reductase (Old Yellow Enzyme family)